MSTAAERAALVARQGVGARYDAAEAPSEELLLARRGTAYFARLLNGLPDDALVENHRALVVARVGYHARGLTRLLTWARTGIETPEHPSEAAREAEVVAGSSLPARALRGLFDHAAIHLDVEWRDLPGPAWDAPLHLLDGTQITARDTPRIRAQLIWAAALDLDAGARATDLPSSLRRG
ncbi:DinB family protein [Gymnodinialimonas sp.]